MTGSYAKIFIVGRLGRDPELRHAGDGTPVVSIPVATTERFKKRDGTPSERTEWHEVVVWGPFAEVCSQHLVKGQRVIVDGVPYSEMYTDKKQVERKVWKIRSTNIQFLDKPRGVTPPPGDPPPPTEGDIPF